MNQFSILEIKQIVESEGLGYAVQDYLSSESILDPKLKQLWDAAQHALNAIEQYLETGRT